MPARLRIPSFDPTFPATISKTSNIDIDSLGQEAIDPGDLDSGANERRNAPEIVGIQPLGNGNLTISFFVDSEPSDVDYPIWVEIYFDHCGDKEYMRRVVFDEDDYRVKNFATTTIPNGVQRLGDGTIVATVTDAERNTSEFSVGY